MGWDEYERHKLKHMNAGSDSDSDSELDDQEDDRQVSSVRRRQSGPSPQRHFDARTNDDHYFMLNAAVSASLILRNACEQQENAIWLTNQNELLKIAFEALSLPEDLFGFESNVQEPTTKAYHREEEMRFEGVREMRLYWVEILRAVAHRMKLFNPTDLVRFNDGTAIRSSAAAAQTAAAIFTSTAQTTDAPISEIIAQKPVDLPTSTRIHSSDQIYTHAALLLHSTTDQALLLAILRFLAQLISNAKGRPELFIEREIFIEGQGQGSSPGIVGRCKELLPLASYSHPLAEAILDCLDASVDVPIDVNEAAMEGDASNGADDMPAEPRMRRVYPNALSVVSLPTSDEQLSAGTSPAYPSQSVITLLSHFLGLSATFWERSEALKLHNALHPFPVIPSQVRHRQETFERVPWYREEDAKWHRLRALKEQSGLVDYVTEREKQQLESLEEPARLDAWLRLVTRTVGDGHRQDNTHYVTQMHIWTSYRDTFEPLVKRGSSEGRTLPGLMAAADVISRVTELFPSTSAVLVIEEDPRLPPNTSKFVIRGLEGNRRPEVTKWNCRWRGCPSPRTDSPEALDQHVTLHVEHSKDGNRCEWSTCKHRVAADEAAKSRLVDHVKTHLPSIEKPKGQEEAEAKKPASKQLSPPPKGRFVRLKAWEEEKKSDEEQKDKSLLLLGNEHPHAKSASQPSRFTYDRPSSINYRVFRTPFDQERKVPEGPAYSCARILKRVAEMCHETLGEDDGSTVEEAELAGDDNEGNASKKLRLDFSDRLEQNRFGSPFWLPPNFERARAEEERTKALKAATALDKGSLNGNGKGSDSAAGVTNGVEQSNKTDAKRPSALTLAKLKSTQALQEILSVEDNLVRWAGCNDILCQTLMEALHAMHRTRGVRIGSRKRKAGDGQEQQ